MKSLLFAEQELLGLHGKNMRNAASIDAFDMHTICLHQQVISDIKQQVSSRDTSVAISC